MKRGKIVMIICMSIIFVGLSGLAAWAILGQHGGEAPGSQAVVSEGTGEDLMAGENLSESESARESEGRENGDTESPADTEETIGPETEEETEALAEDTKSDLENMTLEEKVAQLFILRPEDLTGVDVAVQAGDMTREALEQYPVSGIVYFGQNIQSEDQLREMIANTKEYSKYPIFIGVDEEGGSLVARVANSGIMDVPIYPDMIEIGYTEDPQEAYEVGDGIGSYLSDLGFNLDFAPIADVLTNPDNPVIGVRSFGSDAQIDAQMVPQVVNGLQSHGVSACVKHFPGHGDTDSDSHEGQTVSYRTLDDMRETEFLPFKAGIDAGVDFLMVGHISVPEVTGDMTPSSMSEQVVTGLIREELGYDGIIITDSMQMQAVTLFYSPEEAAVQALLAGVDMLLMPEDFPSAYEGVLEAVYDGTLTEERIDESLARIWSVKGDL